METLEHQLRRMLLPKDPDDDRNVIIEIRGGAGGEEASLFAGSLYRMYTMYAESQGGNRKCSAQMKQSSADSRRSAFRS